MANGACYVIAQLVARTQHCLRMSVARTQHCLSAHVCSRTAHVFS